VLNHISPPLAFLAGLVSFLSPCVLPLVPAYVAYLGGKAGDLEAPARSRLILAGVAFVTGLTLVFVLFFYAFQAILSPFLLLLEPLAGILVIILALQLVGVFRPVFLQREHRLLKTAPTGGGVGGGLLLGLGFATGWTPCVGPTLGAILTSGFVQGTTGPGLLLILSYSLGLGLPFLLLAAGIRVGDARRPRPQPSPPGHRLRLGRGLDPDGDPAAHQPPGLGDAAVHAAPPRVGQPDRRTLGVTTLGWSHGP